MNDKDKLLEQIAMLRAEAQALTTKLQDAKVREQVIDANLVALGDELKKAAESVSWENIHDAIGKAAKVAEDAVQALTDALDEAQVEYE